jgi:endonuclease-8
VLTLETRPVRRLGPDLLADETAVADVVDRLRGGAPARLLGEALLDQRLVAGIGNMWLAESLWEAQISPWAKLHVLSEADRLRALETAAALMHASLDGGREVRRVYRRAGQPCPRCSAAIASWGLGDDNRTAYWCPRCQAGKDPRGA